MHLLTYLLTYLHVCSTANSVVSMKRRDPAIRLGNHYQGFTKYLLIIPVWNYPVFNL